jgi:DNA-binding beta-propeller fold protein YncE
MMSENLFLVSWRRMRFKSVTALLMSACCMGAAVVKKAVNNGVSVEFSMDAGERSATPSARNFREGEDVVVRFRLTDAATGQPLGGASPAAWIDRLPAKDPTRAPSCPDAVKTFLEGSVFSRAELDLNAYYVLALNEDPTITVVDPLFGYGNSKLLALIELKSPGDDWVITPDQTLLFVSMPRAGQVAVIDTATWRVIANLDAGPNVNRLVLQPDNHYLWAAADSGVIAFSVPELKAAARIPTGAGSHWIAVSDDNRFAFATNSDEASVSLIDIRTLTKIQDFKTGPRPMFVDYSALSKMAYVSGEGDGNIAVIDPARLRKIANIQTAPGITQMRFAPGGRYGFVVHPSKDLVYILDAATNRIIQTAGVDKQPDSITFSDKLAYVRHRGSETVMMIPLANVGPVGHPIGVADFPGGRFAPGAMKTPASADGIVQAPGDNAVLVANPGDRMIYFYKEGMAAPMGSFSNYSRAPRAVLVVDRSLKQRSPGVFQTAARLRRPGQYRVAFYLDSPRVIQCFETIEIEPDPQLQAKREPLLEMQIQSSNQPIRAGRPFRFECRLRDRKSGKPAIDLKDVRILAVLEPGVWHLREPATPEPDGVYRAEFTLPRPGIYHVSIECPSHGIQFNTFQYFVIDVTEGAAQ